MEEYKGVRYSMSEQEVVVFGMRNSQRQNKRVRNNMKQYEGIQYSRRE